MKCLQQPQAAFAVAHRATATAAHSSRGVHGGAAAAYLSIPIYEKEIYCPSHRRTDKLALTIGIGDSSAIRPASASPRIVEDLAGSLCRPRREQSVPFHRLG